METYVDAALLKPELVKVFADFVIILFRILTRNLDNKKIQKRD